ncbi:uncharacterized protein [Nicotiana tomentosiformis]|uniref:Uncharacterized protein n=1 Tax=Nicotiana tabacum TaxID=4097 RepID=A0A1S3X4U4_TOBAC|nr:PREDICTED: uncharacterized protein LOC107761181 [Nicotiana tabacum]XP_018628815.1 uncharacterized protein LOC108946424 [Nicotiana tomentosiformis]
MAKLSGNQKSWMEVAVPAVLISPYRISVSPQLETIFEEEDFEDSALYELSSGTENCVVFPKVLSFLKLK